MTRGQRSATASSERPEAFHGTTQRDIHVSEKGQARPPEGPNTATRISVWRPIPEQTTIQPAPALDDDQLALKAELKAYVEKELVLPASDPYAKWEKAFLERPETYPRYLRASKFNLQEAKTRIKGTLEWRRSYKPDLIPPTEIAEEAEGGKVVVNGFDVQGRPIVWLRPSRENTKPSPTQVRHLIWQLERAIDIMPPGVEKLALVVDYKGATSSNNPPMSTAKEVLSILQNHYCERLGRAVVINVPWYLNSFFSVLKPFLDPRTKDKIKFNPELTDLVVNEQLDEEFGGQHAFFYDHRVYMPALCSYCGIKEDGTRVERVPKDQPETRPEELQRTLTSQVDESDRLAEEARAEIEKQEAQNAPPVQGATPDTGTSDKQGESVLENGHVEQPSKGDETAVIAGGAGAAAVVVAGGGGVLAAAAHAKPTDHGQSEVMRILAAQNGSSVSPEAVSAAPKVEAEPVVKPVVEPVAEPINNQAVPAVEDAKATEPEISSRNATVAPETIAVSAPAAAAPAPMVATPAAQSATTAGAISPEPVQNGSAVHAEKPTPVVEATKQQEGKSSIQERSIPTPAPSKTSKPAASEKPKGFKKLLAMCGCAPSGAKTAFDDRPQTKAVPSEKAPAPTPAAEAGVLPAEPSKNKVKIADDAAASKPTTNVPLATNATFGPEAYQTALEGPETGDDYFAQGDLRKAHPLPHDASEKDHAKTVLKPEALMQRLHTGGSGDLVLAFEVKQPGADNAPVEADGEATLASK